MRQGWRICKIANEKALESTRATLAAGEASSSSVDDLDQPLPPATQLELERGFLREYSSRQLPACRLPSGSLPTRVSTSHCHRPPHPRVRNRSQAACAVHTRRKRVSDNLLTTFGAGEQEVRKICDFLEFFRAFRVLAVTRSVAGNFEVQFRGEPVAFFRYSCGLGYVQEMDRVLEMRVFTDSCPGRSSLRKLQYPRFAVLLKRLCLGAWRSPRRSSCSTPSGVNVKTTWYRPLQGSRICTLGERRARDVA